MFVAGLLVASAIPLTLAMLNFEIMDADVAAIVSLWSFMIWA